MNIDANAITLAVFDFDWTIIDNNSDTFFLEQLEPTLLDNLKKERKTNPWNYLIDYNLGLLHEKGYSSQQILDSLDHIPLQQEMKELIELIGEKGHVLRVLSDANNLFIDRILGKHDIREKFDAVTSNPAKIDGNDRIRLKPYHEDDHGCALCPPNLCKGKVLKEWNGFKRVFYFGDGWGDLCPVLKLNPMDFAFVRTGKSLSKFLNKKEEYQTKAKVILWSDAADLLIKVRQVLLNASH